MLEDGGARHGLGSRGRVGNFRLYSKRAIHGTETAMYRLRVRRRATARAGGLKPLRVCCAWAVLIVLSVVVARSAERPNIVLVLLDDMGYGDPGCYNPDSRIPTPTLDCLAAEGLRFTDAHAPGSVCVPSRYGLLTGRYPFRMPRRRGPLLDDDLITLAEFLKRVGYQTACIGKWHLGFEHEKNPAGAILSGGPLDQGFDYYFGIPASLDIPPYYFIRGRRCVAPPTLRTEASGTPGWSPIQGAFWRAGRVATGFRHAEVLRTLVDEAIRQLERMASRGRPFFLYLALTAPHTPWLPPEEFTGVGGAGLYGEFVAYTDAELGRFLRVLDRLGLRGWTLVVVTSDNGPVWYPRDRERFGHSATGPLRGMKGDLWEGGHRVPFIVRWPQRVPAGVVSRYPISFVDLLPTFAELLGARERVPDGLDGVSFAAELFAPGKLDPATRVLLMQGSSRRLAVRRGPWKLIPFRGSGGFTRPAFEGDQSGQLYRLDLDPTESRNLWADRPSVVTQLSGLLRSLTQAPP